MDDSVAQKNRESWNAGAARYSELFHTEKHIRRILDDPSSAFHPTTWKLLQDAVTRFEGLRVCVPSSGDNLAVFAFAALGAQVLSCDIAENQLINAERTAKTYGLSVDFHRADTMTLEGVASESFDLVYTSNGVHVWINDLHAMYQSITRVLKTEGCCAVYEIHPFCRPFAGDCLTEMRVEKPYDITGPFEWNGEITFGWRICDILNAVLDAGLSLRRFEELQAVINYEEPDWTPLTAIMRDGRPVYDRAEVEQLYDWRKNPHAALPQLMTFLARKERAV